MERDVNKKCMKDGYYLSAYVNISELGNVYMMGHRHDNSIALWNVNGENVTLVHYWELERLTGYKHQRISFFDTDQFISDVNLLLKEHGIVYEDLIEVWGVPQLNASSHYLSKHNYPEYAYHCISHLASALFSDMELFRNEKIVSFSIDGGTDCTVDDYRSDSLEKGERDKIEFLSAYSEHGEIKGMLPAISPAVLWGVVSVYYGLEEGTLMALAGACTSECYLQVKDFEYNTNLGREPSLSEPTVRFLEEIDKLTDKDIGVKFNGYDEHFTEKENKISMAMKVIQKMSERLMQKNIDEIIKKYQIDPKETYLAMSGGFALNCPCNTYLMNLYGFKGFISVPCVNDSGMALGIGLYSFFNELGADFNFCLGSANYGDQCDFSKFLAQNEFGDYIKAVNDFNADLAAKDIEEGPVVWFDGKAEIGPRALGNRSILGDPRRQETKDELNRIKQRQWWRPVAPIVLYERMDEWFQQKIDSPYMLQAIQVRDDKADQVQAIMHIDHSSRVQTMKESDQSLLRDVLVAFERRTGVGILCNTSLNDKGEPIVNTIEEAMNFALRKMIKIVYINGHRIVLKNWEKYTQRRPRVREFPMLVWNSKGIRNQLLSEYNPDGLSFQDMCYCIVVANKGTGILYKDYLNQIKEHVSVLKENTILKKQMAMMVYASIKDVNSKLSVE